MSTAPYAVLGTIEFNVIAYWSGIDQQQGLDFAEHALVGRKPRLQFVGEKLDTVKIDLKFHASYCDPEAELKKLRDAMAEKKVLRLVMGDGRYQGSFVIEILGNVHRKTSAKGTKLIIEASLGLKEYVEPKPLEAKRAAAKDRGKKNTKTGKKRKTKLKATGRTRNKR
jgi:phage protein U